MSQLSRTKLPAVYVGQHEVEQNRIEGPGGDFFQGVASVHRLGDAVPVRT